MTPVALERFRPLMKRPDRLGVGSIQHPAAVAAHVDEPHFEQDAQVLRNRGLRQPQRVHNLPHRPFLQRKIVQNLPPPRLRHGIKRIRGCRRPCHEPNDTFLYGNVSSSFSCLSATMPCPEALPSCREGFALTIPAVLGCPLRRKGVKSRQLCGGPPMNSLYLRWRLILAAVVC